MPRPFVVLQSYQEPRSTTNPYIVMLGESLSALADVEVLTFSWRRALTARYDAFHMHWPEIRVGGRTAPRRIAQQAMFGILMLRLRLTRRAIVRTAHNLRLPEGISRRETALLRLADRWTNLRIRLNNSTEIPEGQAYVTIPLGHFKGWFESYPQSPAIVGRIVFFGLIRRYKGVEQLVTAFREVPSTADLSLVVAGKPSGSGLASSLAAAAGEDDRIDLRLEFLTDAALVSLVTSAELVVLPYREMHNSAGALTALSLGRPVLMPANEVNQNMSAEIGPGWILPYSGDLKGSDLLEAIETIRGEDRPKSPPDLSARDWKTVGIEHLAAYRLAAGIARRRGRRSQSPRT